MIERLFPVVRLPIPFEQFRQLPRNGSYKYEYFDGRALLTPRLRFFHAQLDLTPGDVPEVVDAHEPIVFRPFQSADWNDLARPFVAAFARVAPFCQLNDEEALTAARGCLEHTRAGNDGPLVEPACFVAHSQQSGHICAAILVTLLSPGDLSDFQTFRWDPPPPPDAVTARLGQPHLTWVFTSYLYAGFGIGSALLAAASQALLTLGYSHLASSFLAGNEYSVLWHWRNGFRLLPNPGSNRLLWGGVARLRPRNSPVAPDDRQQGEAAQ